MSHLNSSHDRSNEYLEDGVTNYPRKARKHPRPLSSIANRKGKSSQLVNLVQGYKHSLMSPHAKALDKSKRRNEKKNSK